MSLEHGDELLEFLESIWGSKKAYVYVAVKKDESIFEIPRAMEWPDSKGVLSKWLLTQSTRGAEVYFSPATYDDPSVGKIKKNVEGTRTLWTDLDGNAAEADELLHAVGLPEPTYRVSTGRTGHEHWYWVLGSQIGAQAAEDLNARIAYALNADRGCWNADRVLRVPFTENHMIGKLERLSPGETAPLPVDFVSLTHNAYETDSFHHLPKVKQQITESVELGNIPLITDVVRKYTWDDKHYDIFKAENQELIKDRDNHYMIMAHWCAEKGMSDEEIYSVVADLDTRLGKFINRSDRQRQLVAMVSKVRAKHPNTGIDMVSVEEDMQLLYTLPELLEADFNIEWLIEDLIPLKTINFLSAQSGIGKSRLALNLGLECVRGGDFLGWKIENPLKVLYISLEMEGTMLKHFATSLMEGDSPQDADKNFIFAPVGSSIDLNSPEGDKYVRYLIQESSPDLVFIDAMGSLTFDELGEVQAKGINNNLKKMIKEFGVTFFIIHHNKKPTEDKRPTLSDVYGSQYVLTEAAIALTMWQSTEDIELLCIKSRAAKAPETKHMTGKRGFRFELASKYGHPVAHEEETGKHYSDI